MVSKKAKKIVRKCTETNQVGYVSVVSKNSTLKKAKKFNRQLRKHTIHKVVDKLK